MRGMGTGVSAVRSQLRRLLHRPHGLATVARLQRQRHLQRIAAGIAQTRGGVEAPIQVPAIEEVLLGLLVGRLGEHHIASAKGPRRQGVAMIIAAPAHRDMPTNGRIRW